MQEELLSLWEEARFSLVFVTHSIEEALVVGTRIGVLSPHPTTFQIGTDPGRARRDLAVPGGASVDSLHR
jgi:ABC-type nitrate/sulfonate/bicarbonate transport system ATPase subunit